jgi:hypothetical protein
MVFPGLAETRAAASVAPETCAAGRWRRKIQYRASFYFIDLQRLLKVISRFRDRPEVVDEPRKRKTPDESTIWGFFFKLIRRPLTPCDHM